MKNLSETGRLLRLYLVKTYGDTPQEDIYTRRRMGDLAMWGNADLEMLANLMNESFPQDKEEWDDEHDYLVVRLIKQNGRPVDWNEKDEAWLVKQRGRFPGYEEI